MTPGQPGFGQPGQPGFGQPGQPGQFGQFGQPGFAPLAPAPAPKRASKVKRVVQIVVGVAVLSVIGFSIYWSSAYGASGADVGDCIKVNSVSLTDADVEQIDCGAPEAAYKVGKRLDSASDSCPGDRVYVEYSESSRRSDGFTLCLMLNVKVGDCLKSEGNTLTSRAAKVSCGDPDVKAKVVKVQEGVSDESVCNEDEYPVVYPEPATTVCLGDPAAS